MKFHLMFIVFLLSNLHNYGAQGIRLGRVVLSSSNHQAITKISSIEAGNQDKDLIAKTDELPSGINRKLMTNITSSLPTTNNISKNYKNDGNKYDPKPDIIGPVGNEDDFLFNLSPENWKLGKEGAEEPCPDNIDIVVKDYSAPKSKPPSHN